MRYVQCTQARRALQRHAQSFDTRGDGIVADRKGFEIMKLGYRCSQVLQPFAIEIVVAERNSCERRTERKTIRQSCVRQVW